MKENHEKSNTSHAEDAVQEADDQEDEVTLHVEIGEVEENEAVIVVEEETAPDSPAA